MKTNVKTTVIFKENPYSPNDGEVMEGTFYLSENGLTPNRSQAREFTIKEATKFCSRGGGWDWCMK